jgi:hypothetical protein
MLKSPKAWSITYAVICRKGENAVCSTGDARAGRVGVVD